MTKILDIIGALFSFSSTIFYIRISALAWPLGLIAIGIDIFLYYQKGIYGDVGLQCIYLLLTFYGWYQWQFGGDNRDELPITSITSNLFWILTLLTIVTITVLFLILKYYSDSQIPALDAITTVLSLTAEWLMCRKIIQTWVLWFCVDSIYACIYLYKGLPAHGLLQIIYLVMAIAGFLYWRRQLVMDSSIIQS